MMVGSKGGASRGDQELEQKDQGVNVDQHCHLGLWVFLQSHVTVCCLCVFISKELFLGSGKEGDINI